MLVLTRRKREEIIIDGRIVVAVIGFRGDAVRLGIAAPAEMPVHRREVQDQVDREREEGGRR